jgi:hypothetical protein
MATAFPWLQGWKYGRRAGQCKHSSRLEGFERYRLWLLKNSLAELPPKMCRVRMPYKRFSPISDTFLWSLLLGRFSGKSSFSTPTPDYIN